MNQHFIEKVKINKVRHLQNIEISLSKDECKHLIFTGKNGSGKTSVLEAISNVFHNMFHVDDFGNAVIGNFINRIDGMFDIDIRFNDMCCVQQKYIEGNFVIAFYKAERQYNIANSKFIEKITFHNQYKINEQPGHNFVKYLLDMKSSQALYATNGQKERAEEIQKWFDSFDAVLGQIFDNKEIYLDFNIENFEFKIVEPDKEPFAFNELSSGYAAVLDIVTDIMMRMEGKSKHVYNLEGIVIIDEIETHLHLSLQKNILPILTRLFPNIQFIVSTHSPFVLNSLDNAVIYDLATHTLVNSDVGLSNIPYEGIVEGYFNTSQLSAELMEKFARYKHLVSKDVLSDDDINEIVHLESYLDDIPGYLALNIAADYKKLQLELMNKEM